MTVPDQIRLSIAQPRYIHGADSERNVGVAEELIARAAADDSDLILFPEGSPGPSLHQPRDGYDPTERMQTAASTHNIAVCWSRMEQGPDGNYMLVVYVLDQHGSLVARYERAHPATNHPSEANHGLWTAPGPELSPVFTIKDVPMGIVVCSELWPPESARVLAVKGAEVILSPAGGGFTSLSDNWQLIVRVRAIENLCHVAMTNNRWSDEPGIATLAGPERIIITSGTEELLTATIDLARARWLRDQDDSFSEPKGFDSIPGLVRARRPELYGALAARDGTAFDYFSDPTVTAN